MSNDLAKAIGIRVRAGRANVGMTRKHLAAAAGVSERYLHELENGTANPSIGILLKISEALGLHVLDLMTAGAERAGEDTGTPTRLPALDRLLVTMSLSEQQGALPLVEHYLADRRKSLKGIALLGLRGAGKTTLGRMLAERHRISFVSITLAIEERAGMSLGDLFNLGGPDAYRTLENEVIAEVIDRDGPIVLETAGGIVGNPQALETILLRYRTVWLKAAPEEHLSRVASQGDTRPMQGNPKALDHLKALLALREPEYARAECVVDTTGRTVEACLADLERAASPLLG